MSAIRTQQYPGTVLSFFVHWVETMWQPPIKNPEGLGYLRLVVVGIRGGACVDLRISDNREISKNASRNPLPRCARTERSCCAKTRSLEHSHTTHDTSAAGEQTIARPWLDDSSHPAHVGLFHHTFPCGRASARCGGRC